MDEFDDKYKKDSKKECMKKRDPLKDYNRKFKKMMIAQQKQHFEKFEKTLNFNEVIPPNQTEKNEANEE